MMNLQGVDKVVDFEDGDRLCILDFTSSNTELTEDILLDTNLFSEWVNVKLAKDGSRYGIGGYDENRTIYLRSGHFNTEEEPRSLHLGTDIWGPAGTPIYSFSDAVVHSFAFNDQFGDYGATIILRHEFDGNSIYVLYGHLSRSSLFGLEAGLGIAKGVRFAEFGIPEENGNWPPHLHFQLINDMEGLKGDYPGVCKYSLRAQYLANSPNPNLILSNTFKTITF
jgi:murein DD-endopeptidase MepM/ murein hydrolase activator NlpD